MVMPSPVASSLVVIRSQPLLELLTALPDAPPYLGEEDKAAKTRLRRRVGEPKFHGWRPPDSALRARTV